MSVVPIGHTGCVDQCGCTDFCDWWFRVSGLPLCSKLESTVLISGAMLGWAFQEAGGRLVFLGAPAQTYQT